MIYRREIDGLRAVAVIPVILFHAGVTVFSGGYVGVDVFFVISGYLITSILIGELEQGNFSIARFYERRARRILPALFFVMLCCLPVAWMWMLPNELKDFSQSVAAVSGFVSNILFWREEGYFAPAAGLKPLLHTWSLAVEEQYYVLFPVFLMACWRFGQNRVFWAVAGMALVSLALSEWGWRNKPSANFYLAPTRAWELLAGSLCAFRLFGRQQPTNNWLSLMGLVMIVSAIVYYDSATPFPSVYALLPVVGTALIIMFGGAGTAVAGLLGTRVLVGVGLISYSAYLWHQPLFAFARIRVFPEPPQSLMVALAGLALVLAYLSWRYVEKPFRKGPASRLPTQRSVFAASIVLGGLFLTLGLIGHFKEGFPSRSRGQENLANLEYRLAVNQGLSAECDEEFKNTAGCYTSQSPKVLLWGDSFAMHLVQGIVASDPGVALQQHTIANCSPILGLSALTGTTERAARHCIAFNDSVLAWLNRHKSVDLVILSSRFAGVTAGEVMTRDGQAHRADEIALVRNALVDTATRIRATGAKVVIVSPTPASGFDNGLCLARASFSGGPIANCSFKLDLQEKPFRLVRSVENAVPAFWLTDAICDDRVCHPKHGDIFLYRDGGHLSREGSAYLGRTYGWMDQFRRIAR